MISKRDSPCAVLRLGCTDVRALTCDLGIVAPDMDDLLVEVDIICALEPPYSCGLTNQFESKKDSLPDFSHPERLSFMLLRKRIASQLVQLIPFLTGQMNARSDTTISNALLVHGTQNHLNSSRMAQDPCQCNGCVCHTLFFRHGTNRVIERLVLGTGEEGSFKHTML